MESMLRKMSKKSSPESTLEYPPDECELPDDDVLEEFEAEGEPEACALGASSARAPSAAARTSAVALWRCFTGFTCIARLAAAPRGHRLITSGRRRMPSVRRPPAGPRPPPLP